MAKHSLKTSRQTPRTGEPDDIRRQRQTSAGRKAEAKRRRAKRFQRNKGGSIEKA